MKRIRPPKSTFLSSCRVLAFFLFFLIAPFCLLSQAAVITVPGDYSTIQAAIDAAMEGDEIIVSQGTYYENVNFLGKNIILRSTEPTSPTVVANTVIDGRSTDSVVKFLGTENESCVLSGFTITNGYAANGGGIYGNNTLATIRNDNITTNTAYGLYTIGHGGGLYKCNGTIQNNTISGNTTMVGGGLAHCNGTIQNNTIISNWADSGGGLSLCQGTIQNNIISGNTTEARGGGLSNCDGIIQNNIISGNTTEASGGGLYYCEGTVQNNIISGNLAGGDGGGLSWCDGTVQNNIISGNLAGEDGGGLYWCNGTIQNNTISNNRAYRRGGGLDYCHGFIINCIIWGNSARAGSQVYECSLLFYSCIQNWTFGGIGNISADPRFINPTNDDYHLRDDSPCIDGGNRYYLMGDYIADIDGECRIAGISVDMGCDEYDSLPDSDGDLLPNLVELTQGSDPNNADTDGDGLRDGVEALRGTDPTYFNIPSGIFIPTDVPSIQQGLFLAFPSEVVTIEPGTYYENLNFLGKNVILQSSNPFDDDIVNSTIIDGNALFSVIFFTGTENVTCAIKGLTICNGVAPNGGGICGSGTRASIENNKILRNSGIGSYSSYGAGLYRCDGTIQNNTISDNFGVSSGGGLAYCHGTIQNNTISGNWARINGGGLYHCRDTIIQNNIISGNSAGSGGGIYYCGDTIEKNTVSGNSANYGGGISECYAAIKNNAISGNSAQNDGGGIYSCGDTIENNTVSGNSANYGGGLAYCFYIIQNNIILGNSAQNDGGGIYNCWATIQNNAITSNSASSGGGLYNYIDYAIIQNNIISGNRATVSGGGISNCYNIIQNNTISGNAASYFGGGLFGCTAIQNNTITGNSAKYGGGLYGCYGFIVNCIITENENYGFYESIPYYHPRMEYCDIYGNSNGDYYDYDTATSYTGTEINDLPEVHNCISAEPYLVDPAGGNFHLQPISPCIDAGGFVANLTQDFEGDPRPMDGTSEARGDGSDFDIGADEFTGVVTLQDFNFDLTEEGWGLVEISHFTPPHFDYTPGQLILTAQDNTNTYGFWTSELDAVPVIADCLYRARWTVATDVTDPLAVPNMLLRINSQNYQQADMLVVSSAGDGSYAPTPEGRTYEMYFVPPESALGKPEDQDDLILSFDIMNFDAGDAADGSLMLDRVVVEAIPLYALSTPTVLKTWSFETDSEGWEFGSIPLFTAPLSGVGAGALWLIAQDNTKTFGFWSGPSEEVEMEEGKLYRLRFSVSTDVTTRENVPKLRLRASSEDFQSSIVKVISSLTGAEMSPTPEGRTYDLYFYPPQSLVGTTQNSLPAAFDILNFDPGDSASGALMLDGVVVESFDLVP